jgi:type VII secretion integral membrane protein EccD
MTTPVSGEMCRLVVCGPDRHIDIAVPAQVVLADLLPVLVRQLGEDLADTGLLHGGWVLQRLGSAPFDDDATVASLGLHDGDEVHLRPRSDQIPAVDFDDLLDGLATGLRGRAGRWRPEMTRWTAVGLLAILLGAGLAVLAMPGPPSQRTLAAAGLAVGWFAAAVAVTHAVEDRLLGLAFATAAIGYAGLSGLLAPNVGAGTTRGMLAGPQLFTGAVTVLAAASIGAALVGWARPFFLAVVVAGLSAVGGVALATFASMSAARSASLVAVVSTVAGTVVPLMAFRLAGLRLAPLPTTPEHLQEDLDPLPSEEVLASSVDADRYMTALYAGLGLPAGVAMVLLGLVGGWAPVTMVALATLVRTLAARPMTSARHRLAVVAPGAAGLVAAMLHAAVTQPRLRLLVPVVAVPLAAAGMVMVALVMPGRRMMPYWGRIGDLIHTLATLAMFPVLLDILDVYAYARGLGG